MAIIGMLLVPALLGVLVFSLARHGEGSDAMFLAVVAGAACAILMAEFRKSGISGALGRLWAYDWVVVVLLVVLMVSIARGNARPDVISHAISFGALFLAFAVLARRGKSGRS